MRLLVLLFLLVGSVARASSVGAVIPRDRWVSPVSGNDSNAGTPDHPWASMTPVNAASLAPDAVVYIKGGETVYLANLAPTSSGTSGHPVVITSYGTGRATLSGGTPVTAWTEVDVPNTIWRASYNAGSATPRAIWVNNQRVSRSATTSLGSMTATGTGWTSTFLASAAFPSQVEMTMKGAFWTINKVQVTGANSTSITIDPTVKALLTLTQSVWGTAGDGSGAGGNALPFEADNVYEVFTGNHAAATFFYDPTGHFLYLVPPAGVSDPNSATVVAGVNETVVTLSNLHDVTLGNLQISHTTCLAPYGTYNYVDVQTGALAGADFAPNAGIWTGTLTTIKAAVSIDTCTRVKLSGTLVYQTDGIGVEIVGSSSACELDGSIISDTGGSNLQLGKPGFTYNQGQHTQPPLQPQPTTPNIHDSVLQFAGRDFISHANLIGWYYDTAYIGYNLIHDANYSTVAIGWGFGMFGPGLLGGDLVERNEVYNAGSTRVTDAGLLYFNGINEASLGQRECRFNYVHDIVGTVGTAAAVAGIYYDGGAYRNNSHDNVVVNAQDLSWNLNSDDNGSFDQTPRVAPRNILISTTGNSSATRGDGSLGQNTTAAVTVLSTGAAQAAGVALGTGPRAAYAGVRTEAAALLR